MSRSSPTSNASGFTLIELMVAMVIGLIVIGAVLALSLAMIRANSDTISGTRLTQELRATAAVITSELQRAGSAENPFDLAATTALGAVNSATDGCVIYQYSDDAGAAVNRAISLSKGAVYLGTTECGEGGGARRLSSTGITIHALTFTRTGRTFTVTLAGYLPDSASVSRSYSQTVFAPGLGLGPI